MVTLKKWPDWNEGLCGWGQRWGRGLGRSLDQEMRLHYEGRISSEDSDSRGAEHGNITFGQRWNGGAHE